VWENKELYDMVISLRRHGMSYNEIIGEVLRSESITLSKSTVSDWVSGRHHPYGSVHELLQGPSPELAYVIGVSKGDATIRVQKWSYRIRLRVIDKEFAEEFDRCASIVIGSERHSIHWLRKQSLWCVEICSVLLFRILDQPFSALKAFVSHCGECASAFLRGFFDSEASMSGRSLAVSNGRLGILRFAKIMLAKLSIDTTGPRLAEKGGRLVLIKGRICRANLNIYSLRVRSRSLEGYSRHVGFSVRRKQIALNRALGTKA